MYGLNAAEIRKFTRRDPIAQERVAYRRRPDPHFQTYGPKTRREFLALRKLGLD